MSSALSLINFMGFCYSGGDSTASNDVMLVCKEQRKSVRHPCKSIFFAHFRGIICNISYPKYYWKWNMLHLHLTSWAPLQLLAAVGQGDISVDWNFPFKGYFEQSTVTENTPCKRMWNLKSESQTCRDERNVSPGYFYISFCFPRGQQSIGQEVASPNC